MSDSDDEIQFVHKQKIVHYGSLEEEERRRLEAQPQNDSESGGSDGKQLLTFLFSHNV